MNKIVKNQTKKILIMLIIMMCFNFVMPTYSHAGLLEWGTDKILNAFAELLLFIPDTLFQGLQNFFVDPSSIIGSDGYYSIKFAPGTIFAGKVPAFDINFINPEKEGKVGTDIYNIENLIKGNLDNYKSKAKLYTWKEYELKLRNIPKGSKQFYTESYSEYHSGHVYDEYLSYYIEGDYALVYYYAEYYEDDSTEPTDFSYYETKEKIDGDINNYESIASKLQSTIASWYNVMKEVALVGLLAILIYIAIRIIISSAAHDKVKYKKMLGNWFAAICILFILQFIISLTFTCVRNNNRCNWKICSRTRR